MKENHYKVYQSEYLKRLKKALQNWIILQNHEIAFTLTINQDLPKHIAEKIFKKFWNLAERKLQGNKRRRFGVGLERMVCLERGDSLNPNSPKGWCMWHQHGTIKCPKKYSIELWKLRIKLNLTNKVEYLNPPFLVSVRDLGWSQYSGKQFTPELNQLNLFATQFDYPTNKRKIELLNKLDKKNQREDMQIQPNFFSSISKNIKKSTKPDSIQIENLVKKFLENGGKIKNC